jgi:hypothetical protein
MAKKHSLETVYRVVDRQALEYLQQRFDMRRILDTIDALDRIRSRLCEADGLRQTLLNLHGMAHALRNGAVYPAGRAAEEPIWELAEHLASDVLACIEQLEAAYETINALIALAPSGEGGTEEVEGEDI